MEWWQHRTTATFEFLSWEIFASQSVSLSFGEPQGTRKEKEARHLQTNSLNRSDLQSPWSIWNSTPIQLIVWIYKHWKQSHFFFLFLCTTCMVWKGRTGRRGATECRRMMNSQTGIKFHDWDSWAVMAVDQRSATPPSWVQPMAVRALFPTGSLRRR